MKPRSVYLFAFAWILSLLLLAFLPGCAEGRIRNHQEAIVRQSLDNEGKPYLQESNYISKVTGSQAVLGGKYQMEDFNYSRGIAPDGSVTGSVSFGSSSQDGAPSPEQLQGMFQMYQMLYGRGSPFPAISPSPLAPSTNAVPATNAPVALP